MVKKLNERLAELRKQCSLTQMELAEKINYSDKVISKWERGESLPDINTIQILANFYNMSIDDLLNSNRDVDYSKVILSRNEEEIKERKRRKRFTRMVNIKVNIMFALTSYILLNILLIYLNFTYTPKVIWFIYPLIALGFWPMTFIIIYYKVKAKYLYEEKN